MTAYVAAFLIIAAVALFVAAPLSEGFRRYKRRSESEAGHLEHEHQLAIQGLRELEFDNEMGKLEPTDYVALKTHLENRALAAMRGLEQLNRPRLVVAQASRNAPVVRPAHINFCPQCGSRAAIGYHFCPSCGTALDAVTQGRVQAQ